MSSNVTLAHPIATRAAKKKCAGTAHPQRRPESAAIAQGASSPGRSLYVRFTPKASELYALQRTPLCAISRHNPGGPITIVFGSRSQIPTSSRCSRTLSYPSRRSSQPLWI